MCSMRSMCGEFIFCNWGPSLKVHHGQCLTSLDGTCLDLPAEGVLFGRGLCWFMDWCFLWRSGKRHCWFKDAYFAQLCWQSLHTGFLPLKSLFMLTNVAFLSCCLLQYLWNAQVVKKSAVDDIFHEHLRILIVWPVGVEFETSTHCHPFCPQAVWNFGHPLVALLVLILCWIVAVAGPDFCCAKVLQAQVWLMRSWMHSLKALRASWHSSCPGCWEECCSVVMWTWPKSVKRFCGDIIWLFAKLALAGFGSTACPLKLF